MKIILHAGSLKTGSTYLQDMIWNNLEAFAGAGIFVPQTGVQSKHHYDIARASGFGFQTQSLVREVADSLLADLAAELAASDCEIALLSSEHFDIGVSAGSIARLQDCLTGHELRVVLYLRNQVDLVQSLYFEHLKWGGIMTFGEFVSHELRQGSLAYEPRVVKWMAAGVEVCVVDYGQVRAGLAESFLALVPGSPCVTDLNLPKHAVNESLAPEAMEYLRLTNSVLADAAARRDAYLELEQNLRSAGSRWCHARSLAVPPELMEALPRLSLGNKRLAWKAGKTVDFLQGDLLTYEKLRGGDTWLDMEAFYADLTKDEGLMASS